MCSCSLWTVIYDLLFFTVLFYIQLHLNPLILVICYFCSLISRYLYFCWPSEVVPVLHLHVQIWSWLAPKNRYYLGQNAKIEASEQGLPIRGWNIVGYHHLLYTVCQSKATMTLQNRFLFRLVTQPHYIHYMCPLASFYSVPSQQAAGSGYRGSIGTLIWYLFNELLKQRVSKISKLFCSLSDMLWLKKKSRKF